MVIAFSDLVFCFEPVRVEELDPQTRHRLSHIDLVAYSKEFEDNDFRVELNKESPPLIEVNLLFINLE